MANVLAFFMIIAFLALAVLIIRIPIAIAKSRGITGDNLTTISILSWIGILFGVTWIIALVLSLVWQPGDDNRWLGAPNGTDVDKLDKLHKLKQRGVITQKEFDTEKKKILG